MRKNKFDADLPSQKSPLIERCPSLRVAFCIAAIAATALAVAVLRPQIVATVSPVPADPNESTAADRHVRGSQDPSHRESGDTASMLAGELAGLKAEIAELKAKKSVAELEADLVSLKEELAEFRATKEDADHAVLKAAVSDLREDLDGLTAKVGNVAAAAAHPPATSPSPAAPTPPASVAPLQQSNSVAPPPDQSKHCRLEFMDYSPSAAEQAWGQELADKKPGRVCPLIQVSPFTGWIQTWVTGALAAAADMAADGNTGQAKGADEPFLAMLSRTAGMTAAVAEGVFSVLWFNDTCTGERVPQYIEPLLGTLRDPRPVCGGWKPPLRSVFPSDDIVSKDTILMDKAFLHDVARGLEGGGGVGRGSDVAQAGGRPDGDPSPRLPRVIVFDLGSSTYVNQPSLQSLYWCVPVQGAAPGLV
jgi:ribosomal protein L29